MTSFEKLRSFDMPYNESNDEKPSPLATTVIISNSAPPTSVISPLETLDEINQPFLKQQSTKPILMTDVSRRLNQRKILHHRLHSISNIMFFLGLVGVILMIIENEMTFLNIDHKQTILSLLLKTTISITTLLLIGLVISYNRLSCSLYAVNNSLDNWYAGLTSQKIFLILLEIFICLIHPFPRYIPFIHYTKPDNSTIISSLSPSDIEIDVALGLPMFARIYLLCRFIMFHSHLVHNASSQSLGYLNQVAINFFFLIKTYLEQWPIRCLLIFSLFLFVIGSWSLRACNYTSTATHMSILDSMWLFIVTFTTVGYGDLTPSTYCGRSIAGIIGLLGILSTALLTSVLAQKLQLSRSEKYVHNFVINIQLAQERRYQAANVIKFALRVWYLKGKHRTRSVEYIKAKRRLMRSIYFHQQSKHKQKKLTDNYIGFPELMTLEREASNKTQQNIQQSIKMKLKVDQIEEKLVDMSQTMINIQNTLQLVLNRLSQ